MPLLIHSLPRGQREEKEKGKAKANIQISKYPLDALSVDPIGPIEQHESDRKTLHVSH